jgi:acetylornithine deacetylase/succinyl-diaminopimelate desuccinylase-like protein
MPSLKGGLMEEMINAFRAHKAEYLDELKALVRIPSISFPGFAAQEVARSAQAVSEVLTQYGFEDVEILTIPDAHPYVYGEIIVDPAKPTILLYAHHDVQPVGDESKWKTDPFEPVEINDRLFGRGSADDKAGIMVHVAAVHTWLKSEKTLPVNLKILIEGEEESGSTHLGQFVEAYKDKLEADAMVLTDTDNFDTGIPGLVTSLRGVVIMDVKARTIDHSVHSGMWGGPVPDAASALCKTLGSLLDDDGRITIPAIYEKVRSFGEAKKIPLPAGAKAFAQQVKLLDGVSLLGEENPYWENWWQPALMVNALQASSKKDARSVLVDEAWARVSIRIVPDMRADEVYILLEQALSAAVPWGARLECEKVTCVDPWCTTTEHPAFAAAQTALKKGYGKDVVMMGCGGTIPFVQPLCDAFGDVPALLMGIEDPYTNAHGENESLSLSDWEKAVVSAIFLYEELANVL